MRFHKNKFHQFVLDIEAKGYFKKEGSYKNEDYSFWKTFENHTQEKIYQIALLIFKANLNSKEEYMVIQYELLFQNTSVAQLLGLTVCDENINVTQFERMAISLYEKWYLNLS